LIVSAIGVVGRFPTVISDASGGICGCAQSAMPCYQEVWLWLTRTMGTQIEDEEINTSRIRAFVMRWVDTLRRRVDTKMDMARDGMHCTVYQKGK